ncbi:hypothetical protein BJX68DRAFT_244358 [Aspergillus pseudodeflectus]|uniref:Uncharacterized protein n=1 Tax=Aspergillus pseudodeflectus TaxID=176178 RepID=A0ABR4JRY3_9EURO
MEAQGLSFRRSLWPSKTYWVTLDELVFGCSALGLSCVAGLCNVCQGQQPSPACDDCLLCAIFNLHFLRAPFQHFPPS